MVGAGGVVGQTPQTLTMMRKNERIFPKTQYHISAERALCLYYIYTRHTALFALGLFFKPLHGAASRWRLFLFFWLDMLLFDSAYCGLLFLIMACIALLLLCLFGCPYLFLSVSVQCCCRSYLVYKSSIALSDEVNIYNITMVSTTNYLLISMKWQST